MKPEIMLYDEPTSALDPIMTDKINDLILSLRNRLQDDLGGGDARHRLRLQGRRQVWP